MIQVIYGGKGSGKSKRLLDLANDTSKKASGSVVFIDDNSGLIHDLDINIRFIDAQEYGITSPKVFTGFILGISAQDFDLEHIFVDSFLRLVKHSLFELEDMFKKLDEFTKKRDITLTISISGEESDLPDYIGKYVI
ncbi:MAG: twitching motility protein PilT [Clostridia bacterium]|nr:twitching motility protein PilT [Clostridia bacterium]